MPENNREADEELLWKQYSLHTDLYKHYLDLTIKFNQFYYAVLGGILVFYFSRKQTPLLRFSLLFPVVVSFGFGLFLAYAAFLNRNSRREVSELSERLNLSVTPELHVLTALLYLTSFFLFLVTAGLIYIFVHAAPYQPIHAGAPFASPKATNWPFILNCCGLSFNVLGSIVLGVELLLGGELLWRKFKNDIEADIEIAVRTELIPMMQLIVPIVKAVMPEAKEPDYSSVEPQLAQIKKEAVVHVEKKAKKLVGIIGITLLLIGFVLQLIALTAG